MQGSTDDGNITKDSHQNGYKMVYCDNFKSQSNNSKRSRALQTKCEVAISQKKSRKKRNRKRKKDEKLNSLVHEFKAVPLDMDSVRPGTSIYFSGTNHRSIPCMTNNTSHIFSVPLDLHVIDTADGFHVPDVCTLIPRSRVKRHISESKNNGNHDASADIFEALRHIESNKSASNLRGTSKRPVADDSQTKYVCIGAGAYRNKKGIYMGTKGIENNIEAHYGLSFLWKMVEHLSIEFLPSEHLWALRMIRDAAVYPPFPLLSTNNDSKTKRPKGSSVWPSLASGKNVYLPLHTDRDYFLSVTTVVSDHGINDDTVYNYFCFPTMGFAVALRNCDLLIFNPNVKHCLSSRATEKTVYGTSFYLKTLVVSGNDNSVE